jgi:hypothetical protein
MKPLHHRLSLLSLGSSLLLLAACGSDDDEGPGGSAAAGGEGGAGGTGATGGTGAASGTGATGGDGNGACVPDTSGPVQARDAVNEWIRIEIPGAVCSNGSQYPIFVNYSGTSNNLMIALEPGGACWDYASCSPSGGLRGAANPNGISPGIEHMSLRYAHMPLHRKNLEDNPLKDWNMIFVPYCTGDVHTGNNTITYEGPGGEELVFRHNGHDNVQRVIQWVKQNFTNIPQLLVTGCSAGGAGSILNYHFIRQGLGDAVQCSYLFNDSGPIFPSDSNSGPIHEKIRSSWNVDPIIDALEGDLPGITAADIKADFGLINTALALTYPRDRLSITMYRRDLNYSLYSYESFFDFPEYTVIHQMWEEDIALLRGIYDQHDNLGYFIPFWRIDNCSHCVTIPPIGLDGSDISKVFSESWLDSDVKTPSGTVTLQEYVTHLIDDAQPLRSYFEDEQPGEAFTPEEAAVCQGL